MDTRPELRRRWPRRPTATPSRSWSRLPPAVRALSATPLKPRSRVPVFLLRSRGRLRSRAEIEREVAEPLPLDAGVFPAVAIRADVPQPDPRVGPDRVAALPRPLAEREILGQIPVPPSSCRTNGWKNGIIGHPNPSLHTRSRSFSWRSIGDFCGYLHKGEGGLLPEARRMFDTEL